MSLITNFRIIIFFIVITKTAILIAADELIIKPDSTPAKLAITAPAPENLTDYIQQLKDLIENNPNLIKERIILARLYFEQGNPAAAENELNELKALNKLAIDAKEILLLLGYSLLAQGKARAVLEQIKPPNPLSLPLRAQLAILYGRAYFILKEFAAASANFIEALKSNTTINAARIGLALTALAINDLNRAELEINQALKINANSIEAWLIKAEILRLNAKPAEAITAFNQVLMLNPEHLSARLGKAAMELAQQQIELAADDLRIAANLAPDHPLVNKLINLLNNELDSLNLEELLDKLTKSDQDKFDAIIYLKMRNLIIAKINAGHYQAALFAAQRLQKRLPKLALGYIMESAIRIIQKNWNSASRVLNLAYQLEPNGMLALNLYIADHNLGKSNAAMILENWFAQHPDDLETQLLAAITLQNNAQIELAEKYYQKILTMQPQNVTALNNLAWIYLSKHDQRAVIFAKRAYQIAPNNHLILDTYKKVLNLAKN